MPLLALLIVAAGNCGGDSIRSDHRAAYAGQWVIAVDAAPSCWPAFSLNFTIDADDVQPGSPELFNLVSQWWFPSRPADKDLVSGNVNFRNDTFEIVFSRFNRRARFTGSSPSATRMTGNFVDTQEAFITGFCSQASAHAVATHQ